MRLGIVLLAAACGFSQPPEVHPDRTVTFHLKAPKATEVKLWGEWISRYNTLENLTRDGSGTWNFTTAPLDPAIYSYIFLVDGVVVLDPKNPKVQTGSGGASGSVIEIAGPSPLPYELRPVPHGVIHTHIYESTTGLGSRRLIVYTPPGYNTKITYPTLYLFHGSGDTEESWISTGRINAIADNLIAAGTAHPMLIVLCSGEGPGRKEVEADLIRDVVPFVDGHYRTGRKPELRALAGQSAGAFQALWYGLDHSDVFGNLGVFGGGIWDDEGKRQVQEFVSGQHRQFKVFYIATGGRDRNMTLTRRLDETLNQFKLTHEFVSVADRGHTWPFWRECMATFLPRLFH